MLGEATSSPSPAHQRRQSGRPHTGTGTPPPTAPLPADPGILPGVGHPAGLALMQGKEEAAIIRPFCCVEVARPHLPRALILTNSSLSPPYIKSWQESRGM